MQIYTVQVRVEVDEEDKGEIGEQQIRDDIDDCTCIEYCDDDPKTACSLSGIPHVHPETRGFPGITGPCPVHPDRPGDH